MLFPKNILYILYFRHKKINTIKTITDLAFTNKLIYLIVEKEIKHNDHYGS